MQAILPTTKEMEMRRDPVQKTFVTDGSLFLVQLPDDNKFGFVLADDDQTWDGGIGSGMKSPFRAVSPEDVPDDDRERLGWLLD